jgi:glutamate 5-kinase
MATQMFNKEMTRFALMTQKECLESIIESVQDDPKTCGPVFRERIVSKMNELNEKLAKLGQRRSTAGGGGGAPRKLSAYNRFVKEQLPVLVKQSPELDNKARMTRVSEMWKSLKPEDKARYNNDAAL